MMMRLTVMNIIVMGKEALGRPPWHCKGCLSQGCAPEGKLRVQSPCRHSERPGKVEASAQQ
eukprot:7499018-Karenia_brevis.AAC.1